MIKYDFMFLANIIASGLIKLSIKFQPLTLSHTAHSTTVFNYQYLYL
jgi:hypothetical protein